jgi:hypothetical protein
MKYGIVTMILTFTLLLFIGYEMVRSGEELGFFLGTIGFFGMIAGFVALKSYTAKE